VINPAAWNASNPDSGMASFSHLSADSGTCLAPYYLIIPRMREMGNPGNPKIIEKFFVMCYKKGDDKNKTIEKRDFTL
jgi:hypothetical protein